MKTSKPVRIFPDMGAPKFDARFAKKYPAIALRLLLEAWAHQSCHRPGDWAETLASMLEGVVGRSSLRPLIEEAADRLTEAFFGSALPVDPLDTIWHALPRLDAEHRQQLAQRLIEARETVQ
jgi:hypothetical protein